MRSAASVDLLIERVGKQAGRLKVDLLMALYGLTGVSMPYSQVDWKNWWKSASEDWDQRRRAS